MTVTGSKEISNLSAAVVYSIDDKTVGAVTFENTYTYNKYTPPTPEEGNNKGEDEETNIPDDPTPLAPLPELPEEPEVEIPEGQIPPAPVPKTGDASALSGTGLAGVAVLGRKKREEEN